MATCKYCDLEETLEVGKDFVFRDIFSFGILGELNLEAYLSDCNKENEVRLEVQYDLTDTNLNSTDLGVRSVPIKYCPFCGRRF